MVFWSHHKHLRIHNGWWSQCYTAPLKRNNNPHTHDTIPEATGSGAVFADTIPLRFLTKFLNLIKAFEVYIFFKITYKTPNIFRQATYPKSQAINAGPLEPAATKTNQINFKLLKEVGLFTSRTSPQTSLPNPNCSGFSQFNVLNGANFTPVNCKPILMGLISEWHRSLVGYAMQTNKVSSITHSFSIKHNPIWQSENMVGPRQ